MAMDDALGVIDEDEEHVSIFFFDGKEVGMQPTLWGCRHRLFFHLVTKIRKLRKRKCY